MTFLVVGDFILNATLLDPIRLGKQRVEASQIINTIIAINNSTNQKVNKGWVNHPIVKAWTPYLNALKYYANCIIKEFSRRGYQNNMPLYDIPKVIVKPWWANWNRLHQSHRAMLFRKDPFYYEDKFEVEEEYMSYGYIWPNEVSYADRNLPLESITAPIPKELINPVYCPAQLKLRNKNDIVRICHRLVKAKGAKFCGIHNKG